MPKQNGNPKILAAGAAVQLLTGIPAAWGVFQKPVMAQYGFSRGQAMLSFAILVAGYGIGCAIGGFVQDQHGPRYAALWGTALLGGGSMGAALVPQGNAALFFLVYSIPAGVGSAFLAPAVLACAQKWYASRKGLATGVSGAAMGLSGAFLTVLWVLWKTAGGCVSVLPRSVWWCWWCAGHPPPCCKIHPSLPASQTQKRQTTCRLTRWCAPRSTACVLRGWRWQPRPCCCSARRF